MKKRALVCGVMLAVLGFLFCSNNSVYADGGGAVIGGGANSGTSSSGGADMGGDAGVLGTYSWIFYEAVSPGVVSQSINFVPDASYNVDTYWTNGNVIDKECSMHKGGGFWHYGDDRISRNSYYDQAHFGLLAFLHGRPWSSDDIEYSTLLGKKGHFRSYDYAGGSRANYDGDLNQSIYVRNGSGGYDEIYRAAYYDKQYDSQGLGNNGLVNNTDAAKMSHNALTHFMMAWAEKYANGDASKYPFVRNGQPYFPTASDGGMSVYYFCWWPGMGNNFYGITNVSAAKNGETPNMGDTTGIVAKDSRASINGGTIKIDVNQKVDVYFTHNVYSQNPNTSTAWSVPRVVINGDEQDGYSISQPESTITSTRSGTVNIGSNTADGYYVRNEGGYLVNDKVVIEFKKKGNYTVCEKLTVGDSTSFTSQGCIKVNVQGEKEYFGVSNVSLVKSGQSTGGDYTTTGVVSQDSGASAIAKINIKKNEKVDIVFSHNVYSTVVSSNIFWGVTRPNTADFDTNATLAQKSYDRVTFGTPKEHDYYVPRYRQSSDGTWSYILRDKMTISFSGKENGTYTFCEPLKLGSTLANMRSAPVTSEACAVVVVSDNGEDDNTCNTPNCDPVPNKISYSPGVSTVKSEVQNIDLTSRLPSSPFANWRGQTNYATENESVNVTYAKPKDKIKWYNQYSPGAQSNAGVDVVYVNGAEVGSHAAEGVEYNTTNGTVSFGSGGNWVNTIYVSTNWPNYANRVSLFGPQNLGVGTTSMTPVEKKISIKAVDAGKTYDNRIETQGNTPVSSSVSDTGVHPWTIKKWEVVGGYWDGYCWPASSDSEGNVIDPGGCVSWWVDVYDWVTYYYNHTNSVVYGNYEANQIASQSYVKVPYNFINTTSFDVKPTNSSDNLIYSGEKVTVEGTTVTVGEKSNSVVGGEPYATNVNNAQVKMIAYVSDTNQSGAGVVPDFDCNTVRSPYGLCDVLHNASGTLDTNDGKKKDHNGDTILGESFNGTYEIFDAKAGDWFCMSLGVFPATSGDDKNMNPSGDNSWYVTTPSCIQIAKRPSLQIWGGGLYSSGGIDTAVSEKNNIYGLYNNVRYQGSGSYLSGGDAVVFGSWVEEDLIANGKVRNFASGAGLGKNSSISAGAGVTGKVDNKFCSDLVSLTLANKIGNSCSNGSVGYSGIESSMTNRESLVDYFAEIQTNESTSGYTYGIGNYVRKVSATGKIITYYDIDGDVPSLSGLVTVTNNTNIVKASGNIVISGNINYSGPWSGFTSLSQIPKTVIYANKNIYIACNVSRIDAVLIAGGTIDTCYDGGDVNSYARSNQLLVNGVLIADKLIPGRTYGNTMGIVGGSWNVGSESPAEIINYDSSLLLWSQSMAGAAESDTLTVTYQHELAPRY